MESWPARRFVRALAVLVVPMAVLLAGPAWSHATLEESSPGANAVVQQAPTRVTLRFDETVTTLPTSLQIYGPDGSRVDTGEVTHPAGDGSRVAVGSTGNQQGTYLVSWRVVSADSHPISGAFVFSVGKRSAAPVVPQQSADRQVVTLLWLSRWLGYAGSALLVGGTLFLAVCWRSGWDVLRAQLVLWLGWAATAVGIVLGLFVKGPEDAGLGLGAITRHDLFVEVLDSTYGHALTTRGQLLIVAMGVLLFRQHLPTRVWAALASLVGAALLATFGFAGHAVSQHPEWVGIAVDLLHMAAMSIWVGGLVMLLAVALRSGADSDVAPQVVRRFSAVALTAVGALVVTGSYQGWLQVRSWGALTATTYGRELLVKVALVAAVVVVATASRRWVRSGDSDVSVLRRRVSIEALGLVGVLGVTSALVATAPAYTAYHPNVNAILHLGPDVVQVSAVPNGDRRLKLHLSVIDGDQRPIEPKALTASVSLASEDIGPLPLQLSKAGPGQRVGDVSVPMTGDWTLTVDVRTSPIDEYTETVDLPVR